METLKLRDNFYWTGIVDDKLRVFDIIMYTEFGTTYNSYVMKAGDKTILFETAKAKFFEEYLEELKQITDVEKIDYLVVNHTEPDHAGSVEKLLEINPGLKIIAPHLGHIPRQRLQLGLGGELHLLGQRPQQGLLCRNAGLQTIQPGQQHIPVRCWQQYHRWGRRRAGLHLLRLVQPLQFLCR